MEPQYPLSAKRLHALMGNKMQHVPADGQWGHA